MDHLSTREARQEFWYSKHRRPRFVPVHPAEKISDLNDIKYDPVRSIPLGWIENPPVGLDVGRLLQRHGFLVFSGVLTEEECNESLSLAWDWVVGATCAEQAQQDLLDTSKTNTLYESLQSANDDAILGSPHFPRSAEGGLLPFYGSGHSSFAWKIRSNGKVKKIFEALFGTSDLISSLDGVALWHRKMKRVDSGWFHLDQNPLEKPNFDAVQGLVNLLPVTPAVGGNAIVAQSNSIFPDHYLKQQFYQDRLRELNGDDWMEVVRDDDGAFQNRAILCCQLQPGDVLVWDSRTVHCSFPGPLLLHDDLNIEDDDTNTDTSMSHDAFRGLVRAATLVSMMPAGRATPEVLAERQRAVDSCRTLTHWANKAAPLGHEMQEEAAREADLVNRMKALPGKKLLLQFSDLSSKQMELVVGGSS